MKEGWRKKERKRSIGETEKERRSKSPKREGRQGTDPQLPVLPEVVVPGYVSLINKRNTNETSATCMELGLK